MNLWVASISWLLWMNRNVNICYALVCKYPTLNSFGYTSRTGIAKSYGSSIRTFSKNHLLFSIRAEPFCNLTNSAQGFSFLYIPIYICSFLFLIVAIQMAVRQYFVVLMCISLMISDVEYLFICPLNISVSSLGNVLSSPLPIVKSVYLIFWLLSCRSSSYILDVLSHIWLAKIFSIHRLLFHSAMLFDTQNFFFFFLTMLYGMQGLRSPTRDQTHAPCSGRAVS